MVHATSVFNSDRRSVAIRCGVHRAILHLDVHLAAPVLLHIRVFVPGVFDIAGDMCGDHDSAVLLPALQRRLQLVVAGVPDFGVVGGLLVYVRGILFLQEFGDHEGSVGDHVLRVHGHNFVRIFCADRDDRVLCLLLVRTGDLRIGKGRLGSRFSGSMVQLALVQSFSAWWAAQELNQRGHVGIA